MGRRKLYREYDDEGKLVKLECSKCGVVKDGSEFSKDRSKKDGVQTTCNTCRSQQNAQYRQDHKEYFAQYSTQYRQDNKEYYSQYNTQYQQDNKEYYVQYRQDNKEKIAQQKAQYRQDNKEKIAQYNAQYRQDRVDIEIKRIYKNVTQKLYPNSGVQYGVIYGVHCIPTDRWYIGQTIYSFDIRYDGDFFTNKVNELSDSNDKKHLLQKDIEKFGAENFEIHEVLDVAFSVQELDEKEVYYIDKYNSYMGGYNSNRGYIFGRDTIYEN